MSAIDTKYFDKYTVRSAEALKALQDQGKLRGALVITGDEQQSTTLHKIFYLMQKAKSGISEKDKMHLCHAMVATGWDTTTEKEYPEKFSLAQRITRAIRQFFGFEVAPPKMFKKEYPLGRPVWTHAVFDKVKTNTVDYFNYADKDVTFLTLYIPKDEKLREAFAKNAEDSAKKRTMKFSKARLINLIFKKQILKRKENQARKKLAFAVADRLLDKEFSQENNPKAARSFFCMEYALTVLQTSILSEALSKDEKVRMKNMDRSVLAAEILSRISNQKPQDTLARAYWTNKICCQVDPSRMMSAGVAAVLDEVT
ncbi:MAG: hypothetical protein H7A37_07315 [Chlamydiales bacterium]|nr:hypothetical protein [Chlamydiia bacterium]MCP5508092.1 hypothetical protein [Chlamydiales bacterium]